MIVLSKTQIKKLHEHLTKRTGGSAGVRDEGMLDSALHAPFASAFGTERYASVTEKCAALAYFLASEHPFVDGNKRIALLCMLTVLRLNGITVSCTDEELIRFGLELAQDRLTVEQITDWIGQHKI